MANRTYTYPFGNWFTKSILWIILTLLVVIVLFDLLEIASDILRNAVTTEEIIRLVGAVVFGLLFISYATNLYPNIQEVDQGLYVEFFWWKLFIPWENILQMKTGGSFGFHSWTVEVTRLTPIHLLYGLVYLHALRPAFLIFSNLDDSEKLVSSINKHLK